MTDKEKLIYLAGILDGEGCFNVTRCRSSYVPRILVTNTNETLVSWLQQNFGGDVSVTTVKNKENWKPRFQWRLSHKKALELAELVQPYLIVKEFACRHFIVWSAVQSEIPRLERKDWYAELNESIRKANQKGIALNQAGLSKNYS